MNTVVRLLATCTLTLPLTALAAAYTHGAHEHGHAQLNLALDGQQLLIEFEAPAADLVGFEHPPRTRQEQQHYAQALLPLKQADQLFVLPSAAACQLQQQTVSSEAEAHEETEQGHDDASGHHEHEAEEHSDIHASFTFVCQQPEALNSFGVRLFKQYPSLEKISLQAILPTTQTSAELTPTTTALYW